MEAPKTLLLPGNEVISLPTSTSALPPILPSIVEPPRTPTPRRYLTIQELLRSPIRQTTRKKGKKECTRDDRLRIHSYYDAGLTVKQILEKMPYLTQDQVYYSLRHRVTPQRKARGRNPVLDTPKRKQLIKWINQNRITRRTQWSLIPRALGWNCGVEAIANAIQREGYGRFLARRKPVLDDRLKALRLRWALEHINWTNEQWDTVLWSDETWAQPGHHTRVWVTCKLGTEEIYHPDCVEPKVQRKIGWMFWGCISGRYGKGFGVFFEKSWGGITKESYSEYIVPRVAEYMQEHPGLFFQQDNAPGHGANLTKQVLRSYGIQPIWWPPFSPDLAPIESIWDEQKDWIDVLDPEIHRNYQRLRHTVSAAWDRVSDEEVKAQVRTMHARCQAVIDAQGGYTKY
jgi:transposase